MIAKKIVSEYMPPMKVNRLGKRENTVGEKAFEDIMTELKEKGVESVSVSQALHGGRGRIGRGMIDRGMIDCRMIGCRTIGRRTIGCGGRNTKNPNVLDLSNYANVAALTRAR